MTKSEDDSPASPWRAEDDSPASPWRAEGFRSAGVEHSASERNQTDERVFDYMANHARRLGEEDEGLIEEQVARGALRQEERQKLMARRSMHLATDAKAGFHENVAAAGRETTEMMLGSLLDSKKSYGKLRHLQRMLRVDWILDIIDEEWARRRSRDFVHRFPRLHEFVSSDVFEVAMALLMAANTLNLGLEVSADEDVDADRIRLHEMLENVFTVLLIVEIFLRVLCDGWVWIFNRTNVFDTVLVFGTIVPNWILKPSGAPGDIVRAFALPRVFRLARLLRAVRRFSYFRTLWYLVDGILDSLGIFLFAWLLMGSTIYVFAIGAVYAIGRADALVDDALAQTCFGNVADAMFMLFQTMTLDDWSSVTRKLMPHSPLVVPMFIAAIMVLTMLLANLVTSVILRNTIGLAAQDRELASRWKMQEREENHGELRRLLFELAKDGSGTLSLYEYERALQNRESIQDTFAALGIKPDEQREVWSFVSLRSEDVSVDDLCAMVQAIRGEAKAKDMFAILRRVEKANGAVKRLKSRMTSNQAFVEALKAECREVRQQFGHVQEELADFLAQLSGLVPNSPTECDRRALGELDRRVGRRMEYLK